MDKQFYENRALIKTLLSFAERSYVCKKEKRTSGCDKFNLIMARAKSTISVGFVNRFQCCPSLSSHTYAAARRCIQLLEKAPSHPLTVYTATAVT